MLAYDDQPAVDEISPEVQEQIAQNPGKWLAITRDSVVAVGDTPLEALQAAVSSGVTEVILHKSLESDSLYLF